jgi:hypothetical protein
MHMALVLLARVQVVIENSPYTPSLYRAVIVAMNCAPLVWINGFPGSGKLTVATAIATMHKSAIVLDNHKLIDPVEARFPRTHPSYQHERRSYRQAVLEKYACDTNTLSRLVVFTGMAIFCDTK